MKNANLALAALSYLAVMSILPLQAEPKTVVRVTNGEWPPYLGESLPHRGLASRIVTEAFAVTGIEVEYGFFPWSRALKLAEIGEWDAAAVWLPSPERSLAFRVSDPVIDARYVFFHLRERKFSWKSVADLKGLKIGATISYHYGKEFQDAEKAGIISVERVPTDEQNLKKLLLGRIDIFPMDDIVGREMLKSILPPEKADSVSFHPTPLHSDPLCLMISRRIPGSAELAAKFNRGLATLRASGRHAAIISGKTAPAP